MFVLFKECFGSFKVFQVKHSSIQLLRVHHETHLECCKLELFSLSVYGIVVYNNIGLIQLFMAYTDRDETHAPSSYYKYSFGHMTLFFVLVSKNWLGNYVGFYLNSYSVFMLFADWLVYSKSGVIATQYAATVYLK